MPAHPEWFHEQEKSIQLTVKISPGSKNTKILSFDEAAPWLKIAIHSPPEKGKANSALLSFLSKLFSVPLSSCSILSGHTSSKKKISIEKKMAYTECKTCIEKSNL